MKFNVQSSDLKKVVGQVKMAVSSNGNGTQGILIEAKGSEITFSATNFTTEIIGKIKVLAVEQEGSVLVDGKLFSEVVAKLPNKEISFALGEEKLNISCGKSKFSLSIMNVDSFTKKEEDFEGELKINKDTFVNMAIETIFATSTDEAKKILTGVLVNVKNQSLEMVGLDGYRLSLSRRTLSESVGEMNCVIPAASMDLLIKSIGKEKDDEIRIKTSGTAIRFELEGLTLTTQLLDGDFIDYEQILPKDRKTRFTVNKDVILGAIDRAMIMSKKDNNCLVKLSINSSKVNITASNESGTTEEEVPVEVDGEELEIAFNGKYLVEGLKAMDKGEVNFNLISSINPMTITTENEEMVYLALPVRMA